MMGSRESEGWGYERGGETLHKVTLTSGFWLARTPVTQLQWKSVMGNNPAEFKGDELPVESVSWEDCMEFCQKAGLQLPTEAQWEYACRAGGSGPYAGTGRLEDMGWFKDNSDTTTHPVGKKRPNAWGLFDMCGNVAEWCMDTWEFDLGKIPVTDPVKNSSKDSRVLRGGSWDDDARHCRSDFHGLGTTNHKYKYNDRGLRPCLLA
jgi:formylglycine-generating enzyme required for sulfatase activity